MNKVIDTFPLHDTQVWGIESNGIGKEGVYSATLTSLKIDGKIDIERLEKVLGDVVAKYDSLRFIIEKDENGNYVNRLIDEFDVKLDVVKLVGETVEEKEKQMFEIGDEMIKFVGRIEGNRLFDFKIFDFGNDEYVLLAAISHMITDGFSNTIITAEIISLYNGGELKPTMKSYESIVKEALEFKKSEEGQAQVRYWEEKIKDYNSDYIVFPKENRKSAELQPLVDLPKSEIAKFARSSKTSPFVVVLFLYHLAVAATYGVNDTMINVADANRSLKTRQAVGLIMATYSTRIRYSDDATIAEIWEECKQESRTAAKNISTSACFSYKSKFAISYFNYSVNAPQVMKLGENATAGNYSHFSAGRVWDLFAVLATETPEKIILRGGYDPDVFTPEIMEKFCNALRSALKCLTENNSISFREFKELNQN